MNMNLYLEHPIFLLFYTYLLTQIMMDLYIIL